MKCFICENEKAVSYYSPKELTKYNIYFCNECIKNLKGTYLQYLYDSNNQKYVSNELKLTLKHKSQG